MSDDRIDELLTSIITMVSGAPYTEAVKADIFARIVSGMRQVVWPHLLAHVPPDVQDGLESQKIPMTMDQYADIITTALKDPETAAQIHERLVAALEEVETMTKQYLSV